MQTRFTKAQLADPEIAEAAAILETCVHYGFCTNTCPTYVLTRDENESPRGRIDLIKEMLEQGGPPPPKTVGHIDSCLSCLSCMTTCAAKVDYVHLIDRARVHIERHYRRPLGDRMLRRILAETIPRPRLFSAALRLGRIGKAFPHLLPRRLRELIKLMPARPRTEVLGPQVFAPVGARRYRVALLAGCAQQALNGNINRATIRLLQRLGCEVVVAAGAGCCGSLNLHMGRERNAKHAALALIHAWEREIGRGGLDAVIVNASGCGTTIKDYGHLFAKDADRPSAENIARLAFDVTEFVAKIGLGAPVGNFGHRVAYHDPCSMQHGQKVVAQPRKLLQAAGFHLREIPENHFCCGSAGSYNLLQPAMAERLGRRKAENITGTDPDILATGNIGCMTQLAVYLGLPVVHTVELLDWATGGPRPPALEGRALREPESEGESKSGGAPDSEMHGKQSLPEQDATGFW